MQEVQLVEVLLQFKQFPVQLRQDLDVESAYVVAGQGDWHAPLYKNCTPSQLKHEDDEQLTQWVVQLAQTKFTVSAYVPKGQVARQSKFSK